MSYENLLFHQQNRAIAKAQAAYDAQEPEEPWDCEEDGHVWRRLAGESEDGTRFAKCWTCGAVEEI